MIRKGHVLEAIEVQDTAVYGLAYIWTLLAAHIMRKKHPCLLVAFILGKDSIHLPAGKSAVISHE